MRHGHQGGLVEGIPGDRLLIGVESVHRNCCIDFESALGVRTFR